MRTAALLACLSFGTPATADPARIEAVEARERADGWVISVTLRHSDTGWDDYADGWQIETQDGRVLARRDLEHPHVTEQPFTRSQTGIDIPPDIAVVNIRARTTAEGWDEDSVAVTLPR